MKIANKKVKKKQELDFQVQDLDLVQEKRRSIEKDLLQDLETEIDIRKVKKENIVDQDPDQKEKNLRNIKAEKDLPDLDQNPEERAKKNNKKSNSNNKE